VTLVARHRGRLAALADDLRADGIGVDTVTGDVADPHGFRTVLEQVASRTTPDVVVCNAASVAADRILTSDVDHLLATRARPRPDRRDLLGAAQPARR
jgi:short-subunit dehydrogenase